MERRVRAAPHECNYSLGTTETNGRIFGAVSVVAVRVMAVLPLQFCALGGRAGVFREKIEELNKSRSFPGVNSARRWIGCGLGWIRSGTGIHFCLRHQLARIEAKSALEALLKLWPQLKLAGSANPVRFRQRPGLRAIEKLMVAA